MECLAIMIELGAKTKMRKEMFTVKELSNVINIKESTLYSWVSQGNIPHIKLGKKVLFDSDDIEKWMEEHKRQPIKAWDGSY